MALVLKVSSTFSQNLNIKYLFSLLFVWLVAASLFVSFTIILLSFLRQLDRNEAKRWFIFHIIFKFLFFFAWCDWDKKIDYENKWQQKCELERLLVEINLLLQQTLRYCSWVFNRRYALAVCACATRLKCQQLHSSRSL